MGPAIAVVVFGAAFAMAAAGLSFVWLVPPVLIRFAGGLLLHYTDHPELRERVGLVVGELIGAVFFCAMFYGLGLLARPWLQ